MKNEKLYEILGEINEKHIKEAGESRNAGKTIRIKRGAAVVAAACLCLVAAGGILISRNGNSAIPDPDPVQVTNPMIKAASVEEMEQYLDFDVPVLDKEVASYYVFVLDSYPTVGQIDYADGSEFRIQYGSGDISGIYGSTPDVIKDVDGIKVECYNYEAISYAVWEQNGFTFSYSFTDSAEIETIIRQCNTLY